MGGFYGQIIKVKLQFSHFINNPIDKKSSFFYCSLTLLFGRTGSVDFYGKCLTNQRFQFKKSHSITLRMIKSFAASHGRRKK